MRLLTAILIVLIPLMFLNLILIMPSLIWCMSKGKYFNNYTNQVIDLALLTCEKVEKLWKHY